MKDLDLVATFLEIYRRGSLTGAARALGLSQPAVSGQLVRLEEQVGGTLFTRSRNGAEPTPRAHELARRVGPHLDGLRQALRTDDEDAVRGTVRLGSAAEFAGARLLPALAPLTRHGLTVKLTLDLAEPLLTLLAEERLDLVVSSVRPPPTLRGADRDAVRGRGVRAGRRPHRGPYRRSGPAGGRPGRRPRPPPARHVRRRAADHPPVLAQRVRPPPPNPVAVVVPDLRAVLTAVAADAGISVLPRYLAEPALRSGALEQLHRSPVPPLNTLYLVTRTGPLPPPVQRVRAHLVDQAADWGPL
ncbi:LysR family transcriptional regulator [Streptomyces thermocoprophilus]